MSFAGVMLFSNLALSENWIKKTRPDLNRNKCMYCWLLNIFNMCDIVLHNSCVLFPESDQKHSYRGGQHCQGSVQRDRVTSVGPCLSGELLWP